MKTVQVGVFKAKFSEILQQVKEKGESFIIEYGKSRRKVAMLIPFHEAPIPQSTRVFGYLKNRASFKLQDDFEMTDDEFLNGE
jgi:antitoxin (DNA-binding transcriptional repressor) of toxin-antitoxin stability system